MATSRSVENHDHSHSQNRYAVIPTYERLLADPRYTGRGVTIAFLDSGFYPHPDIADRVIAFHDVHEEERSYHEIAEAQPHHWHGTQTTVSCAGDGRLSDGVYRGIAHMAELVLVKVSRKGRIIDASIEKGLRWVLANHEKYGIRILNISLGGDRDATATESCIDQLAEELVRRGIIVTVAAGNSAETHSIPPANSPSVITVGGYSDHNEPEPRELGLYNSSFGPTADHIVKPEIIAPAMFVAAPIVPDTPDQRIAERLSRLAAAPDYSLRGLLEKFVTEAGLSSGILNSDLDAARRLIGLELQRRRLVATHYQQVDGTSFAAPVTASVVAQMIESNPDLTPAAVRDILISTASKLAHHPAIRQGFGMLNAALAVERATQERHLLVSETYSPPRIEGSKIIFHHHDDAAVDVALVGDFNEWDGRAARFCRNPDGLWRAEIPCQPAGEYRYKFLVNGSRWTEDVSHGFKEDDGYGGFNSILRIGT